MADYNRLDGDGIGIFAHAPYQPSSSVGRVFGHSGYPDGLSSGGPG